MAGCLSSRQITKLKKDFLALDEDGNGVITTRELGTILREAQKISKLRLSEREIQKILYDFDQDGNGEVEVNEFLTAMANRGDKDTIIKAFTMHTRTRKAFLKADADRNGWLSRDEFMKCLQKTTKAKLGKEELAELMKEADRNNDGKINYDEFLVAISKY